MNRFSADWLALRAPFDAQARAGPPVRALATWFSDALAFVEQPRIADLGGGTGANVAQLAPLIGGEARWTVMDSDTDLLALAKGRADHSIEVECRDLSDLGVVNIGRFDAVTGAAFLDLVSQAWVDQLIDACTRARCAMYFCLTVDGRVRWQPPDSADAEVLEAFHQDQRRDKGFGPALGPRAGSYLAARLRSAGAQVATAPSDWRIAARDTAMLHAMIDGFATVQRESAEPWATCRRRQACAGELSLRVGHIDVAARW